MNLTIYTSRHSKYSAIALGDTLDCNVFNPYQHEYYKGNTHLTNLHYNMGCSGVNDSGFNSANQIAWCTNKVSTFQQLEAYGVLCVPHTDNVFTAQEWINEDRIIVNRATITGKANEGMSYSYKGLPGTEDVPLNFDSVIWTRYVNHNRELRVYAIKGQTPLIFWKEQHGLEWHFKTIRLTNKLKGQLDKANQAFDKMFLVAYDILECVTGDYYFLEANSAPSLLAHGSILPIVAEAIQRQIEGMGRS